jgi:MFS family permease
MTSFLLGWVIFAASLLGTLGAATLGAWLVDRFWPVPAARGAERRAGRRRARVLVFNNVPAGGRVDTLHRPR